MLKPMDIHNKEFKKSVRGYDAEEVDQFLDEIIIVVKQRENVWGVMWDFLGTSLIKLKEAMLLIQ